MLYAIQVLENTTPPPERNIIHVFRRYFQYYTLRNDLKHILCNEIRMKAQISLSEICFSTRCEEEG